jgi:hypothetical protein
MEVGVTALLNGAAQTYTYVQEARMTEDYKNNRAKLGKGLMGRYAQFRLSSSEPFRLLGAEVDIATGARRV